MELPEHYLPVRVCPHVGEGDRFRLMFAECGSYENINLQVNNEEESITFLPQKGQQCVKNLSRNIPSLPLFDCPLKDELIEWDHILGMKNYNEILNDLKPLTIMVKNKRATIKNASKKEFAKRFHACNKIIKDICDKGSSDLNDIPAKQCSDLLQRLDKGIHTIYYRYEKAADVYANKASCLKGYNRDFYGGLLAVVKVDHDTSADVLIHAGGTSFQDISMTEVSCKSGSRLKQAKLLDKVSLKEPVFQITTSSVCSDDGLICARQKHKCLLFSSSDAGHKLVQKDHMDVPSEFLTSVSLSPYMKNEILMSTDTGSVYLWDISSSSKNRLLVKSQDNSCQDRWSCSYFGGHPRHVVVADNTSVAMFDHRSNFSDGVDLFCLSPNLTKKEERVMAATSLGFPYHAVVTDYGIFIIDHRFGLAPVLQWSTEFISCPQYIQVLQEQRNEAEQDNILFVASQQPPEVMCFPMNIQRGCSPTSPILPWKISQIGDFSLSRHTSYVCDMSKVEKRFETSLAGVAVSRQSTPNGFTVYQVDGYGDVFYQPLIQNRADDFYNLESCTEEDRHQADKQAENWLVAFESSGVRAQQPLFSSVNLAPNILADIFSDEPIKGRMEHKPDPPVPRKSLHRNLKALNKISSKGSSARLHLALRDNKDIKELLLKREHDHTKMKKQIRRLNLKKLKTLNRFERRGKICSAAFCESDSSDDNDNIDTRQNASRETKRSTCMQDRCQETIVTEILKTEVLETCDDREANSHPMSDFEDQCSPSNSTLPCTDVLKQENLVDMEGDQSCEDNRSTELEHDHTKMKKKTRRLKLKALNKFKKGGKICSAAFCESDSSDDNDNIDTRQNASSEIKRSTCMQDRCQETIVTEILKTEVLEPCDDREANSHPMSDFEDRCSPSNSTLPCTDVLKQENLVDMEGDQSCEDNRSTELVRNCSKQLQDIANSMNVMEPSYHDRQLSCFIKLEVMDNESSSTPTLDYHFVINQNKVRHSFGKSTNLTLDANKHYSDTESKVDMLDCRSAEGTLSPTTCYADTLPGIPSASKFTDEATSKDISLNGKTTRSSISSLSSYSLLPVSDTDSSDTSSQLMKKISQREEQLYPAYTRKFERKLAVKNNIALLNASSSLLKIRAKKKNERSGKTCTKKRKH